MYLFTRLFRYGCGCSNTLVALLVAAEDGQRAVGEGNRKACTKDKQRISSRARHPVDGLIIMLLWYRKACGWVYAASFSGTLSREAEEAKRLQLLMRIISVRILKGFGTGFRQPSKPQVNLQMLTLTISSKN